VLWPLFHLRILRAKHRRTKLHTHAAKGALPPVTMQPAAFDLSLKEGRDFDGSMPTLLSGIGAGARVVLAIGALEIASARAFSSNWALASRADPGHVPVSLGGQSSNLYVAPSYRLHRLANPRLWALSTQSSYAR
jgi:hypothetical protein